MHPQVMNALQLKELEWRPLDSPKPEGGEELGEVKNPDGTTLVYARVWEDGSLQTEDGQLTLPPGMYTKEQAKKVLLTYYGNLLSHAYAKADSGRVQMTSMHFEPRRADEAYARGRWDRVMQQARGYSDKDETPCTGAVVWRMLQAVQEDYGQGSGVPVLDNVVLGRQRGMAGNNATGIFLLLQNNAIHGWECIAATADPITAGRWSAESGDIVKEVQTIKQLEDHIQAMLDGMYAPDEPVKEETAEQVVAETAQD